jgi:hypothetical protein
MELAVLNTDLIEELTTNTNFLVNRIKNKVFFLFGGILYMSFATNLFSYSRMILNLESWYLCYRHFLLGPVGWL